MPATTHLKPSEIASDTVRLKIIGVYSILKKRYYINTSICLWSAVFSIHKPAVHITSDNYCCWNICQNDHMLWLCIIPCIILTFHTSLLLNLYIIVHHRMCYVVTVELFRKLLISYTLQHHNCIETDKLVTYRANVMIAIMLNIVSSTRNTRRIAFSMISTLNT